MLGWRHRFPANGPRAEGGPEAVKGGADPRCRVEAAEAKHRAVALLDSVMILLRPIVEVLVGAMCHLPPEDPVDRSSVRGMLVGGYSERPTSIALRQRAPALSPCAPKADRAARLWSQSTFRATSSADQFGLSPGSGTRNSGHSLLASRISSGSTSRQSSTTAKCRERELGAS